RGPTGKGFGRTFCPTGQRRMMADDRVAVLKRGLCRRGIGGSGVREGDVEIVLGPLEKGRAGPRKRGGFRAHLQSGGIVFRVEARLKSSDPVTAIGKGELRIVAKPSLHAPPFRIDRCAFRPETQRLDESELDEEQIARLAEACPPSRPKI